MKKITESRKRFSVARLLAMILACMAVFLSSARAATIINVNMGNDGWNPLNGRGFMIGDFAQAPFKYPGTTWNDFSSPFPYGAAGLLDSQGNTTVVGFDTTSSTTIYGMEGPFTTADHVEVPVMRGFVRRVYNSGSGNTWHNRFTITNLTAGASYHLALIGVQGDQAAGAWQIGTATNHPDTAIKTIINSLPIHQNWVPSNNYAIFYNVTADANGRIYVWGKGQPTSGVTYPQGLTLNGFQLTTADVPSPEKQILSFSIGGVPMAIDEVSRTITLAVNGPLTSLTPTITTSAGATCSPASGVARNFSTPQTYTVTAADGTVDAYTVVLSSEKQLLSFKLYGQPMAIDQVNKTVTCNIYGPVTSLTPTITVSVGASCSPASGVARDFTTPQTYTVTALDGSVDSYTITAIQVAPPTITTRADGATLTTFTAPGVGPWTVPAGVSSVEVLTVGGGGGTGSQCSGAGAGGMYHTTGYSVTPGSSVIIAVGAGGVEGFNTGNYSGSSGGAGGISQFGQILAYGGQPGGGYRNGGDQGGYSMNGGTTVIPGVIAFHSSLAGGFYASGAGAGDPGTSYQSDGVPGGNGTNCTITGSEVWYAGGGGSPNNPGTGGRGGGGHGAGSAITEDLMCGTDGLGGGAGGGWGAGTWTGGGRGGSGVVIVAYFVGVTTYEVTFDSKGGSDVPKQTVAAGGTATLPPPPIKAGYTFVQWCSDTGLTTAFDFATPIYANKTLYAKWSINTYTLTYLAGAYGSLIGTTTQTVQYAASGTAVTAVPMTGGTFVKWSDNVTANPRTDSNVSSNITVTAIFNPPFPGIATRSDGATVARFYQGTGTWTVPAGVTSVEVLVVGGGGGACPQSSGAGGGGMYYTTSYSVTPGSTVNIAVGAGGGAGSPPMGSGIPGTNGGISQFGQLLAYGGQGMSGYGPTDDPSGNHGGNQGGYSSDGGAITNAGNLGGICAHGNYASGAGAGAPGVYGNKMPGGDGAPCAISGSDVWYAGGGASMGGSASLGGGGAGAPAEGVDVTFGGTDGLGGGGGGGWLSGRGGAGGSGTVIVAYFVGVTTYTVTFESNGGSTVPKQIVAPNHTATQPPTPTRAGYTFVQWCADSTLTTAFDFATPITANRTLYAKWTMNSYTLIYLSGAYGSLSGTTTQTVQYAASGTAVTAVPMAGATFVKWSDNSTTNPRIDSNVSSNITVTAIFEPPFPGVTILRNGATLVSFYKGSGTWTIPAGLTSVEVLVVGGGGGGGIWSSGSGAGGMYYTENYPVTPGISVGVQVGAGGAGGVVPGQGGNFYGDLGGTSQFDSLFAYGGAAGLGYTDGGDQGGYSTDGGSTIIPGNPGMHYSPMDGNWSTGGGAGGPGNKGDAESGGPGAPCSITGSEVYYAGGGGGNAHGPGGIGGGGSGPAKSGDPTQPGIDGLGGGAGGGWGGPAINAPGGSGIVLVSYFTTSPIYTVSFDSNGGSPVPNNQRVASGYRATQPPTPALPGYTLVGWCTDIGLTTPYNFDTPVTGNLTLYAKWGVETPTVTITSITTDGNGTFTISGMASTDVSVELLHSTDLNAPLSSWATVAGPSAFGPTFSFTVSSTDAQGFFAVRVQ